MTDETRYTATDAPEPPAPTEQPSDGPRMGDAWRDVLSQIDALGESMGRWAHAAVNDPENRRHAEDIKIKLEAMSTRVGQALDDAAKSDVGRSVSEAATKVGAAATEAGTKVADEVAPHVANALSGLADVLGKAAEKVERKTGAAPPAPPAPSEGDSEPDGEA